MLNNTETRQNNLVKERSAYERKDKCEDESRQGKKKSGKDSKEKQIGGITLS